MRIKHLLLLAAVLCLPSCDEFWGNLAFGIRETGWEILGEPAVSDGRAESYFLEVGSEDDVFVSYHRMYWNDSGPSTNSIHVKRLDGDAWRQVGTAIEMPGIPDYAFCLDEDDNPVCAYVSDSIGGFICVRWVDGQWREIGDLSGYNGIPSALTVDDGDVYLAYRRLVDPWNPVVLEYTGGGWNMLGLIDELPNCGTKTCLRIADDGTVYIGFSEGADGRLSIYGYDAVWAPVGSDISAGMASAISLAPAGGDSMYTAYTDSMPGGAVRVKYYDGTDWHDISEGLTDGEAETGEIALDPSGIPFVVYTDFEVSNELNVMRYEAESWTPVGEKGFTYGDVAQFSRMRVLRDGTPVIAYSAVGHGSVVTVMRYTGE